MDRIVTFLLLLVSALLLVPGCIAEEQVTPAATEVAAVAPVVEETAAVAGTEAATEQAAEELVVYNFTADVNTTELVVPVNEKIKVALPENPTTGFTWNVTLSEGLALLNETPVAAVEGMDGAGGIHEWIIQAITTGNQTFSGIEQKAESEETGSEYTLNLIVE